MTAWCLRAGWDIRRWVITLLIERVVLLSIVSIIAHRGLHLSIELRLLQEERISLGEQDSVWIRLDVPSHLVEHVLTEEPEVTLALHALIVTTKNLICRTLGCPGSACFSDELWTPSLR